MSGVGSNSCGPQLAPEYQLKEKRFPFSFMFCFTHVRYAADLEDISIIERCRAFLAEARTGTGVGEYDKTAIEQLKACVTRLEHCQAGQNPAQPGCDSGFWLWRMNRRG